MPASSEALGIVVYAPALESEDSRPAAVIHAMEQALPGVRLEWTVSRENQLVVLPQRDTWLAEARADGGFPLLCNNDETHPVMISARERPAMPGPSGHAILEVHASIPCDAGGIAAASRVLEGIAESARASWGHASPKGLSSELARQMRHSPQGPERSPRGLPMLKLPWHIRTPAVPYHLGWLNYWSAAAARAIGFPDPGRDADLLSRARHTSTGGWVVQLTDAPLDLGDAPHLETLLRTYERFPGIGGRAEP
ncbi:hypothetical protein D7X55_10070 [Corallococcus sp. AB049A]|uniref:Uncharacterized protein n=1 Tax=Corallococcus interemptor TaxID=2316720 RepID=A0A3A8QUE8_9BACT|nr:MULTISPECIES: DUF5953 family protein [Corallococcus]RKH50188.1 hypothetical protein D7Y23_14355 [Corallococcus sp. AB050B]RKH69995.1 hypothetical protein D7X96_13200 [Corallococcus interemptor]RKI70432.1 hypothetical protein D7X55_10070 [Corallococcus sp. AB049A]